MSRIVIETRIRAPIELCFDLARSIELHIESTRHTRERAVAGRTSGLIGLGEEVTWEATHFGIRQRLTSRITAYDRPRHFRDTQIRGAFARYDHDHYFEYENGVTTMRDLFDFDAPLGVLGNLADRLFLRRYLQRLLHARNQSIREAAEA